MQLLKAHLSEPGADPPGVDQPVLTGIDRKQQGPERRAATLRRRVADDHEFLPQAAFELDPVGIALADIRAAGTLADDPFQTHCRRTRDNVLMARLKGIRITQQATFLRVEDLLQGVTTLLKRHFTQVFRAQKRHVEQVIQNVLAVPRVKGILQPLEVGQPLLVENHHFAIEPTVAQLHALERLDQLRQSLGPVMPVASEQTHIVTLNTGQHAIAIEFDFVQPVTGWRRVYQRCQLRRKRVRESRFRFPARRLCSCLRRL